MRSLPSLIFALNLSFNYAQAYVNLGSAATFGALSYASITNTGPTDITGDIGTVGSSVTGFPPGTYTGSKYISTQAIHPFQAAEAAYQAVASLTGAIVLTGNLGGRVLGPGIYEYPSSAQLTGVLTLAGTGSPNDAWYFQIGSTLTTAIGSEVVITGGGQPCNVFWKVGTSATLGIGSEIVGTVLAAVSITANAEATSIGGLFALGASITLNSAFIQAQYCAAPVASSSSSSSLPSSTSSAAASSTYSSSSSSFSSAAQSSTSPSSSVVSSSSSVVPSSSSAAASSSSYASSSSSAAQSSTTSSAVPSTSSTQTSSSTAAPTSTTPIVPTHVPSVGSCVRIGCYTEGNSSRALTPYAYADYDMMSPELCASYCPGSSYFGVEYGGECYCGDEINCGSYDVLDDSQCSMPCDGTPGEYCGGPDRLDMYMCGDISSTATSCAQPTSSLAAMTSSSSAAVSSSSSLPAAASSTTSSSSAPANTPSSSSSSIPAASSSSYAAVSSTISSSSSSLPTPSSSSYAAAASTITSSSLSTSSTTLQSSSSSDPPSSLPTSSSAIYNISSSLSFTPTLSSPVAVSSSSLPPFSNYTSSVQISSTSLIEPIVTSSLVTSTTQALTTSTVYTTNIYTITRCPATVTNCPVGKVTTDIISLYTTVCPVEATSTPKPAPGYTTSTVYTTKVYTITECAATITKCPVGSVTTDIISLYTTVCPIEQAATNTVITPQANNTPASPVSTPIAIISPNQGHPASGNPSAYVGSPAATYTALPVGSSVISGEKIAASPSTYLAINSAPSASGTAKPSTVYTGPAANGVVRKAEARTSLVVIIGMVALML